MVYLYAVMLGAWFGDDIEDEFNGNITGIEARNIWAELIEYAGLQYRDDRIQSLEDWYRSIWDIVREEESIEPPSLAMIANIIHTVNFGDFIYSGNIEDIFNHAPITLQRRFIDYLSRDTITRRNDEEEEYNCESGEDSEQQEHYYMEVNRDDGDNEDSETEDEEDCEDYETEDEEDCEGSNEEMVIEGEISEMDNDGEDYIELLQSDLDALDDDFDFDSMPDLISISESGDDDGVRYFDDALSAIDNETSLQRPTICRI